MKNLFKCTKERIQRGTDALQGLPQDVATAGANALLTPLAEGVAQTTNQMVTMVVTEWLMIPSIRIFDSGVVQAEPDRTSGGSTNGGCLKQQPPAQAPPQSAIPPGQPPSATPPPATTPPTKTSCDQNQALRQLSTAKVQAVMAFVGVIVATLLLIIQAMRTAFTRRGTHLMEALQGLLIMAMMSSLGLILLNGLLLFSDALTSLILNSSMGQDLGERVATMLGLSVAAFGPVPVILFGVFVFTISIAQLVMLFIRQAAIPVLAMLMPVAAAGQVGGQISRQWLVRLWSSLFAVILYKPLAALIFAVGFLEVGEGRGFWALIRGLTTLGLAIFALPTMVKIFNPIVGQAISIGQHNLTLAGFVSGGMSAGTTLGGGDGGGGGGMPASPQAYEGGAEGGAAGGAAGAVPAVGAAMAVGQLATDVAEGADRKIAQGADAFVGGDGAAGPDEDPGDAGGGGGGLGDDGQQPGGQFPPGLDPRDLQQGDIDPSGDTQPDIPTQQREDGQQ